MPTRTARAGSSTEIRQGVHRLKGDRRGQRAMTVNARWASASSFIVATRATSRLSTIMEDEPMAPIAHPGRLLKRELAVRGLSANRLALAVVERDRGREIVRRVQAPDAACRKG
jgi:hypothetical protein